MAVLSRTTAASLLKEAIVLDLGDLTRQGERMVAAARAKAEQILAESRQQAQTEAAEIREREAAEGRSQGMALGLEEGRRQGHAEALAEAQEQLGQLERKWTALATEWEGAREGLEREAKQGVLELGLALGEKLVRRVIEVEPTVVADQLAAALDHVLKPLEVTALIHPQDRRVLEEALPGIAGQFAHLKAVHLKDEASVGRGGCQLRFGQGCIDATIETQLRRIVELLVPSGGVRPPEVERGADSEEGVERKRGEDDEGEAVA